MPFLMEFIVSVGNLHANCTAYLYTKINLKYVAHLVLKIGCAPKIKGSRDADQASFRDDLLC